MTEDEAKTKACFKAATFGGSQQLADGPGPNCIGSACMAWRWTMDPREAEAAWESTAPSGYCGLAGPAQ